MCGVLLQSSVSADWAAADVGSQAVGLVNTPRDLVHGDTRQPGVTSILWSGG